MVKDFLQSPVKSFIAPVWLLGSLTVVLTIFDVTTIMAMREMQFRHGIQPDYTSIALSSFFISLTTAETVCYWFIRYKVFNRRDVWMHLVLFIIAFIMLPVLLMAVNWSLGNFMSTPAYNLFMVVSRLRFYLFWLLFISGNIFFIRVLLRSFKPPSEPEEDLIDAIGR